MGKTALTQCAAASGWTQGTPPSCTPTLSSPNSQREGWMDQLAIGCSSELLTQ